jgi:hypothetical protein
LSLDDFSIAELRTEYEMTPYRGPEDRVFTIDAARARKPGSRRPSKHAKPVLSP